MAKQVSENSVKVLDYLKAAGAGVKFTTKDIQAALGFEYVATVVGSLRGLVKKNVVERFTELVEAEDGKVKEIKYFALTEDGLNYDPYTEVE